MLEAGLAAERGREILLARAQRREPQRFIEPLDGLRRVVFTFSGRLPVQDVFALSLASEYRATGPGQVTASMDGGEVLLNAQSGPLTVHAAVPLRLRSAGVREVASFAAPGLVAVPVIAPRAPRLRLLLPAWAVPPPRGYGVPPYSEPSR